MAEILTSDLTTETLDGTGTFDSLMRTVSEHLREEFKKQRIPGNDYSKVYLGALESTMTQSLQFVLQRQTSDKQAELLSKQAQLIDIEIIGAEKDNLLKDKQLEKMDAEISILAKQEEKLDQDILLSKQQVLKMEQDVLVAQQQVLNMEEQVKKTAAEARLVDQQVTNAQTQNNVLLKQQDKLGSERELIDAKKTSEDAQTKAGIAAVGSILGEQAKLFGAQTQGFTDDANQKAANAAKDGWSVAKSADPENPTHLTPVAFTAEGVDEFFNKLK